MSYPSVQPCPMTPLIGPTNALVIFLVILTRTPGAEQPYGELLHIGKDCIAAGELKLPACVRSVAVPVGEQRVVGVERFALGLGPVGGEVDRHFPFPAG